jgi:ketosteroid isomerase-like protein
LTSHNHDSESLGQAHKMQWIDVWPGGATVKLREAIAEIYKTFEEAFYRGDADGISLMYTEDAEVFAPQAPVIRGRHNIADAWRSIVGQGGNYIRVDTDEVQESGDWAYEAGRFQASAPDGTVLNSGKYIVIWKQQANGVWQTHRDIFNWDISPPA